MPAKPPLSIRRTHAEPAHERMPAAAIGDRASLALWLAADVTRHDTARAVLRAVPRCDRRDAARAGRTAIFVTAITWHDRLRAACRQPSGEE